MNRAVLARLVVPATFGGVAFGFWYTVAHGRSPYADLRAWAKGAPMGLWGRQLLPLNWLAVPVKRPRQPGAAPWTGPHRVARVLHRPASRRLSLWAAQSLSS